MTNECRRTVQDLYKEMREALSQVRGENEALIRKNEGGYNGAGAVTALERKIDAIFSRALGLEGQPLDKLFFEGS